MKLRDCQVGGAGTAAYVVCCAPPLLALLVIAGAGLVANIATIVFAGVVFSFVRTTPG